LSLKRIEIDLLHISGPALPQASAREIGMRLVRNGLTWSVCFNAAGEMEPPTEVIRKRPVAIERGLFKDLRYINPDMLEAGLNGLASELATDSREPLGLMELSVDNLREAEDVTDAEYLQRLHNLFSCGYHVLLTRLRESYSVTEYLRRYSQEPMRYNTGVSTLALMFAEGYYTALSGGLLEAMGKLLANNVKIYAHAMPAESFRNHLSAVNINSAYIHAPESGQVTISNLSMEPPIDLLYQYLVADGWIEGIDTRPGEP